MYQQSTGKLSHSGEFIAEGYSGKPPSVNDPNAQDQPHQGPLPRGTYTIGPPVQDGGHMGPFVLPLTPWSVNNMFQRDGFFIHGDNQERNHTASEGCIILDRQWRNMIASSNDSVLQVTT